MNKRLVIVAMLSILALGVPLSSMGENASLPYQRTGTIDDMDFEHNQIVINDTTYEIAAYVIVHGRNKHVVLRRDSLQKGMTVGFNFTQQNGRSGYIKEMWLLTRHDDRSKE